MNKNNQINDSKFNFDDHEETEIDLREIIKNLFRNYLIILPFPLIFLIMGINKAYKQKDIWQGQFQIVLESSKNANDMRGIGGLDIARLSAFISTTPTSSLTTQVEI